MLAERWGTGTLILTPKVIDRLRGASGSAKSASAEALYQEALRKSFRPVSRSRSVADFEARIQKAIPIYSKQYDQMLYECIAILGPSRFEIEYIKQITKTSKELKDLPFGALDLSELFRRHVVCCTNAAANYEELLESDELYEVERLLRITNYGLTLSVLLLGGTLSGPVWMMGALEHVTSHALLEMEAMPEMRTKPSQLAGSLVLIEGSLDLTPQAGKSR
jgi:hypothetical protein